MTTDTLIASIATRIINIDDADFDTIDFMHDIRDIIAPAIFADLCIAIELCPMHICDFRICLDDDIAECAELHI